MNAAVGVTRCRAHTLEPGNQQHRSPMKHLHRLTWAALAAALFFGVPTAAGQWIPIDIPTTPDESPGDREREKREERHRATISRFFGTTSVTASPILTGTGQFFDTVVEAGVSIDRGDALFIMIGARRASDDPTSPRLGPQVDPTVSGGGLFALGYEVGLERFSSKPAIRRSSVSFSVGAFMSDASMVYVDVSPRYLIRLSPYWTLPVGFKMTTSFLDETARPIGTVGVTAGIRRHFGQRRVLE